MFKARIKLIVLEKIDKERLSGYDLIKSIGEFGKKPSSGYIYPLLKDLEKKNFISMREVGRKKVYSITKRGKTFLKNLKKMQRDMLEKMIEMWKPIAEKKEIDDLIKFRLNEKNNKFSLQDRELITRLHRIIFSFYRRGKIGLRNKMKKVLKEMIEKLEKIK